MAPTIPLISVSPASANDTYNPKGKNTIVTQTVTLKYPDIFKIGDFDAVSIEGCGFTSEVSKPMLPVKAVLIELPSSNIVNVKFEVSDPLTIPGTFYLHPAQPPKPIGGTWDNEFVRPDPLVYSSASPCPGKKGELADIFLHRGKVKAYVRVFPLQYVPATGELLFYDQIKISITINDSAAPLAQEPLAAPMRSTIDYLIVTRAMLASGLEDFVGWEESKGLGVAVENVENIVNNYPGRDVPEKIRNCIRQYYADNGVKWVLIAGDADPADGPPPGGSPNYVLNNDWEVPTRYVWNPCLYDDRWYTDMDWHYTPTDLYYACLDGDFDADGDNLFGEDLKRDVDWFAEVYVGRIPVRTASELGLIVSKTINFENNPLSENFLLLGAEMGWTPGHAKYVKENIKENLVPPTFTAHGLYEIDGTLSSGSTNSAINARNPSFLNAFAHGSPSGLYLYSPVTPFIDLSTDDSITNSGFVMYAFSCLTNAFDVYCLGEDLLKDSDGGAVGYIGGTRVLYGSNSMDWLGERQDYLFWEKIFQNSDLGSSVYGSKMKYIMERAPDLTSIYERRNLLATLLLGDPALFYLPPQPPPASFTPPHSDNVEDTDADGLYNYLIINVGLNVDNAGSYSVVGDLYDNTGSVHIAYAWTVDNLAAGYQTVQLHFDGSMIHLSGTDGPYRVSLDLYDNEYNWLDNDEHETATYTYDQFQPPSAILAPPHSDYGLDTDNDGLYNYLVIEARVSVATPGWYRISSDLYDNAGYYIAHTWVENYLGTGTQTLELRFRGGKIRHSERDGPYRACLILYRWYDWLDEGEHVTAAYSHTQFQTSLILPPTDDAHVLQAYPNVNYGSVDALYVGRYLDSAERAFLKFDLSEIPDGSTIIEARYHSYCFRVNAGGANVQIQAVESDAWTESTITWNNQSTPGAILDGPYLAYISDQWYSWDITDFVAEQFTDDKVVSICMVDTWEDSGTQYSGFESKEWYDATVRPHLEVFYILPTHAVSVSISPDENSGLPGENVIFTVTVTNLGRSDDNYTLENLDNASWSLELENDLLEIPAGENRTTMLIVTVPAGATPCTQDNILVVAVSQTDNTVTDSDTCMAHVLSPKAEFSLITLYEVGLDLDLYLSEGSKLVVKFYTYAGIFENESVFENLTPPTRVVKSGNVSHPENIGIKRARLDLTTDNTENVISTIASFTVIRHILFKGIMTIKGRWPYASPDERNDLFQEIMDIKGQWPYAPS